MTEWVERQVPDSRGGMSNIEFYHATNPAVFESVDYIYDNFEWNHCEDEGVER